jgi:hypothetical protein
VWPVVRRCKNSSVFPRTSRHICLPLSSHCQDQKISNQRANQRWKEGGRSTSM